MRQKSVPVREPANKSWLGLKVRLNFWAWRRRATVPGNARGPRSRVLPFRALAGFSFFRQTECSKAFGLDADGKLFSLIFLHRQRRVSRALLLCSDRGQLLGILQGCFHRHFLNSP
jgi:hypothetical protein